MSEADRVIGPRPQRAEAHELRDRALDEREPHAVQRIEHLRRARRPGRDEQLEELAIAAVRALVDANEVVDDRRGRRGLRTPPLDAAGQRGRAPSQGREYERLLVRSVEVDSAERDAGARGDVRKPERREALEPQLAQRGPFDPRRSALPRVSACALYVRTQCGPPFRCM